MMNENISAPKQEKFRSYRTIRNVSTVISYVLLSILAFIWVVPILWIILSSFAVGENGGMTSVPSTFFPQHWSFTKNYEILFTTNGAIGATNLYFPRWFLNTILVSIFSCILSTIFTLAVAYVMSKLKFSWRKTYLNIAMIIGLFPGFMSMIAIYYILKTFGLTGSLFALILCYSSGAGTGFYVAKGFFDVIPNALVESAKLDGANNAQIFWHIILPMSKPIIIYTALMAFTGPWMDFIFAKVILGDTNVDLWTVSVGLYSMMFGKEQDPTIFSVFAAGCVCVAVPIVTLFFILQRYYVEGVTAGAVK